MDVSAESVAFDENQMWVTLSDGRTLGVPLAWFPRLLHASRGDLEAVERVLTAGLQHDGGPDTGVVEELPHVYDASHEVAHTLQRSQVHSLQH